MNELQILLIIQSIATFALFGMAWFIQTVHYPLYTLIKEGFIEYERAHLRRVSILMGTFMLAEMITGIMLTMTLVEGFKLKLVVFNLILIICIWLWTLFFHIYQHQRLSIHFSQKLLRILISTHWVRTLLWTIKTGVVIAIVY